MAPPLPVPEHVTEAWLFPSAVIKLNEASGYWGIGAYIKLGMEARDKAARLLYEYLTEQQVKDLQENGGINEGNYRILCMYGGSEHPRIDKYLNGKRTNATCVAFQDGREERGHALLPLGDRILAILLKVRVTGRW